MEKQDRNEKMLFTVQDKAYFCSDSHINLQSTDEKELMAKVIQSLLNKIITYQKNGSGWYFKEILHLEIHTVIYHPMKGGPEGSGESYIPLPDWIMRKKLL